MNIIEAENVSYKYPDGTLALKNVNFFAKKNKITAILGPNGAGKTTLLLHFNGILKPISGRIIVDGKPIDYSKEGLMEVRQKVGIVFQNPDDQLFAPTVEEDVAFGPLNLGLDEDEIKRRVHEALSKVGMKGFENKAPHHLSGGQKKRVAIAGVLAMKPKVMILDEPTSGLDPKGASQIVKLIHELNESGTTIIISTHDVDLVPLLADYVYIMKDGQIIEKGKPKKTFSEVDVIRNSDLRLPRVAHLIEIMTKKDGLPFSKPYPLTIGEARRYLIKFIRKIKCQKKNYSN